MFRGCSVFTQPEVPRSDKPGCNVLMHIQPYGSDATALAADLANRPPRDSAELRWRCEAAGLDLADVSCTSEDLIAVQQLLKEWSALVDSPNHVSRAARLNDMLAAGSMYPRIVRHGPLGDWHLHYRDDSATLSDILCALVCVGTAVHLTSRGMHRLARCAAGECDVIFADTSPTGRRQYCSTTCSNRSAVRRHRSRARVTLD